MPPGSAASVRMVFYRSLWGGLRVVWPILSVLLLLKVAMGLAIGALEGWGRFESIYFAFITGLTIGYGDLVPSLVPARVLAVAIGFCGILLTGVVAALVVRALQAAVPER